VIAQAASPKSAQDCSICGDAACVVGATGSTCAYRCSTDDDCGAGEHCAIVEATGSGACVAEPAAAAPVAPEDRLNCLCCFETEGSRITRCYPWKCGTACG
jgi:hypothetical protein